jgi:hypothetical protein
MHRLRAISGRTVCFVIGAVLTACSVYDSDLLVAERPDAVTAAALDAGIVTPTARDGQADSGPVLGPDETPPNKPATNETRCGDGQVTGVEKCDTAIADGKAGACPTDCPTVVMCTPRALNGSGCQAECVLRTLVCQSGDHCCPGNCNSDNDTDCSASCGDGIVQESRGETCEPKSATPCKKSDADCDDHDACTVDKLTGSASNCNAACTNMPATANLTADGCCPDGANATTDGDCMPICGNGVREAGEDCDGGTACTADCKVNGNADRDRCLATATTACEKCGCMSCTAQELACRSNPDPDSNTKCQAVTACTQTNKCVGVDCYCTLLCTTAGPCVASIEIAAGSTDAVTIQARMMDPSNPLGRAYASDQCRSAQCASACR